MGTLAGVWGNTAPFVLAVGLLAQLLECCYHVCGVHVGVVVRLQHESGVHVVHHPLDRQEDLQRRDAGSMLLGRMKGPYEYTHVSVGGSRRAVDPLVCYFSSAPMMIDTCSALVLVLSTLYTMER